MAKIKDPLVKKSIDTVRILSADAVQKANSGHPGTPMALAPAGYILWKEVMNYNPKNPDWPNRDRFVLSCGHACMLQYSFLYLTGYDLTMDDIKDFRQLGSKTAGHPEYGLLDGIEVTTGPLGQGFSNGVGMAIAQQYLAKRYNKPGFDLFDYKIYAICSDGDLMEGVASEAASIAGTLGLGNMVYLYDDNDITIEGDTDKAFKEDVQKRFDAYGWHTQRVGDVNDLEALKEAIKNAEQETDRPSLILVKSEIGYGSPNKQGSASTHGAPLGEDELKLVKEHFGFDPNKSFVVPDDVADLYKKAGEQGAPKEEEWNKLFEKYKKEYPELAEEYETFSSGNLPEGWESKVPVFTPEDGKMATRKASGKVLNAIADSLPTFIGGSADLAPSNNTNLDKYESFNAENHGGRNFHFGIREHAMGAILNGMALTKGIRPFGGTFLIFADYMKPAIRLASIMEINPIYVFTHDSIGLGEDGTTHQPIEQLLLLRSIHNATVIRPADANETAEAWKAALKHKGGPIALALTRQGLPTVDRNKYAPADGLQKGAYVLSDSKGDPDLILIGSGSEVQLALEAQEKLAADDIDARVVSMPSWGLFEAQSEDYKESVLPKAIKKRLAIEAASPIGWLKYVTDEGDVIGIDGFGVSGPGAEVMAEFGFTTENVVKRAKALL